MNAMKKSFLIPATHRPSSRFASVPRRDHTSLISLWPRLSSMSHRRQCLTGGGWLRLLVAGILLLSLDACKCSRQATSAVREVTDSTVKAEAHASSLTLDSVVSNLAVQFDDLDIEWTFSLPVSVPSVLTEGIADTTAALQDCDVLAGMFPPLAFTPAQFGDPATARATDVTLRLRSSHAAFSSEGAATHVEAKASHSVDSLRAQHSASAESAASSSQPSHSIATAVAVTVIIVLVIMIAFCLLLFRALQ